MGKKLNLCVDALVGGMMNLSEWPLVAHAISVKIWLCSRYEGEARFANDNKSYFCFVILQIFLSLKVYYDRFWKLSPQVTLWDAIVILTIYTRTLVRFIKRANLS